MRRTIFALVVFLLYGAAKAAPAQAATPGWPSLAQQLAEDHVIPGSTLEKLINDNQDFSRLLPEEAGDPTIRPWLRVLWRKSHPETARDPKHPIYPFILNEIHTWMLYHQDLQPGPAPTSSTLVERAASVGPNGRISNVAPPPKSESDIKLDYWDTTKVIAAANDNEATGRQAQFYSHDGGNTWGQTSLSLQSGDSFQADPTVDWTFDGTTTTAWAATLGIVMGNPSVSLHVEVFKSTDFGVTWNFDSFISGSETGPDKEMMWVDHNSASPNKNNVYVIWNWNGAITVNHRSASSGTWGSPVAVSGSESLNPTGADIKTNSAGDVFATWESTPFGGPGTSGFWVAKSTDGGASFSTPLAIGNAYAARSIQIPAQSIRTVLMYVSGAAYRTASQNLVYASWTDLTGGFACNTPASAPGTNVSSICKTRIWFTRSTNGGATWSPAVMLNNQASLNDQFFPRMVVDETSGALSIVYYDTVNDTNRVKTDVWYQSSYDSGVTWGTPFKVTSAQSDETTNQDGGNQYGDYIGISGYNGLFLPSWTDHRDSGGEEIWGAGVQDLSQPPTARFNFTCALLACSFDGTGSTPGSSPIATYGWTFGDTGTGAGATTAHTYGVKGQYSVTLKVTDTLGLTSSITRLVSVTSDTPAAAERYFAVLPCRVFDSRATVPRTPLTSSQSTIVAVANTCGIPSTAKAVWLNVTAVGPTGQGHMVFYPGDLPASQAPGSTTINFAPATSARGANAILRLATNGAGSLGVLPYVVGAAPNQVDLIVDVNGYFSEDAAPAPGAIGPLGFATLPQCRILDTRNSVPHAPLASGVVSNFTVQGVCGIPAGAVAAALNTTVVGPTNFGDLVYYPAGTSFPLASNLNFPTGTGVLANGAGTRLASTTPDLSVVFVSTGPGYTADLILDTSGYFKSDALLAYHPITACRAVDTRFAGQGTPAIANGTTRNFQIQGNCGVPVGAKAAFISMVVVGPTNDGMLVAFPSGATFPPTSSLNFAALDVLANGAVMPLSSNNADLSIFGLVPPSGSVNVIVDVFGYFQ